MQVQCFREKKTDASDKEHGISVLFFFFFPTGEAPLSWYEFQILAQRIKNDANPVYQQCLTCQA